MRHAQQPKVYNQLHMLPGGSMKVFALSGRNICERTWRHIFAISKTIFFIDRSKFKCGMRPREHKNLNMKRNRISTEQDTVILLTLLEDKIDTMLDKARTLPNNLRVTEMILPRRTKWKKFLITINYVSIWYIVYLSAWYVSVNKKIKINDC